MFVNSSWTLNLSFKLRGPMQLRAEDVGNYFTFPSARARSCSASDVYAFERLDQVHRASTKQGKQVGKLSQTRLLFTSLYICTLPA